MKKFELGIITFVMSLIMINSSNVFSQAGNDYCNITLTADHRKISDHACKLAMDESDEPVEFVTKELLQKHASDANKELTEAIKIHEELKKIIPERYSRRTALLYAALEKDYAAAQKDLRKLSKELNKNRTKKSKIIKLAVQLNEVIVKAEKEHKNLELEMKKYYLASR